MTLKKFVLTLGPTLMSPAYDILAPFIDEYWASLYVDQTLPGIEEICLGKLEPGGKILDLCCGTGHFAREMASRGFRTTGIDISSGMLSYARRNSPKTDFIEGDVLSTPLGTSYQAAFCLFITMVEFTEVKKLQKLFCRVHKALKPGGLFIFDTYLEEGFAATPDSQQFSYSGGEWQVEKLKKLDSRITSFKVKVSEKDSNKPPECVTLRQRCHTESEISRCISVAGFRTITVRDWTDGDAYEREIVGRRVYVVKKV